jgi:hypothetical protein
MPGKLHEHCICGVLLMAVKVKERRDKIMTPIYMKYQVKASDFRKASYYVLALQKQRTLKMIGTVFLIAVIYFFVRSSGLVSDKPLFLFFILGYLLWGILLFIGVERNIKRYVTSPENMLGKNYEVVFRKEDISFKVSEDGTVQDLSLRRLYCVFELSALFLVYVNESKTYIVPKRNTTKENIETIRSNFQKELGNRFSSRY